MKTSTFTRSDICNAIQKETGLPKAEASVLLESMIDHISSALSRDEDVKLAGFGTFLWQHKKSRIGRNPKTGQTIPISDRQVVVFKPSKKLKSRVAEGCAMKDK